MATQAVSLFNGSTTPDPASANVRIEPYSIKATNDIFPFNVAIFDDTGTADKVFGRIRIPKNYVSSPVAKLAWSSTVITGNVVWDLAYRVVSGDDTTSMDQATVQETVTVTDAAPGAAHRLLEPSFGALTAGNFSAAAQLEWQLIRRGDSGSDTMAGAAIVFDLQLEYADA